MALLLGCAVNENGAPEASMGIHAADLDADGDWDLFMTHVRGEKNTFYLNTKGSFSDRTSVTGLVTPSRPMTGFGMGFVDFDLDGHLDLFVANGRVELWRPYVRDDMPYAEPNQVFRGGAALRFTEIDAGIGGLVGTSRGAAFGDYDNDGDIDIVYMDLNAPVRLLENIAPRHGGWIAFRLLNGHGSDSIGAVARIETPAGPQFRRCDPSYSYTAANDPRVHFGLGPASEASNVLVTWPDGKREEFGSKPGGQVHILRQGTGTAFAR
jgi:hypothetical protein